MSSKLTYAKHFAKINFKLLKWWWSCKNEWNVSQWCQKWCNRSKTRHDIKKDVLPNVPLVTFNTYTIDKYFVRNKFSCLKRRWSCKRWRHNFQKLHCQNVPGLHVSKFAANYEYTRSNHWNLLHIPKIQNQGISRRF